MNNPSCLFNRVLCALLMAVILQSCTELFPGMPADDEVLDGTVEGLSFDQARRFLAGDIAFNNDIFSPETGLGPLFVATSCGTCHPGDGKGHPFTSFFRYGQSDTTGNKFLDRGGPQLQNRAIPGYTPETMPASASFSKIIPPANTGLGFLDAVPDATLLRFSDPNDVDGDGISGVPNWIIKPDYSTPRSGSITRGDGRYIGRFGKKAGAYDLLQQTAAAYNQDIGITSSFEPVDTYSNVHGDPEVTDNVVMDVVFYLKTLKAPVRRSQRDSDVIAGEQIFSQTGCAKCHLEELETGPSPISALAFRKFSPYTDLLLHDMGPELDDGYTEGIAMSSEWRTPALWGIGLSKNSQGGRYFLLHDGRAAGIEEAIEFHGGEASRSRHEFRNLSEKDKQLMIRFIESL